MYFDDKDLREDQSFEMPQGESLGGVEGGMDEEHTQDLLEEDNLNDTENMDTTYYAIMGVIVLVMLYILYSMYTALTPVENQTITPVETTQTTIDVPKPVEQAPIMQQPTVSTPAPVEKEVVVDEKPSDKQVTNELAKQQQAINSISEDTEFLEKAQAEINTKIDKLSRQVDMVITHLDNMMEEAKDKQVKEERALQQKKEQIQANKAPPIIYYIRAVVEGRAWLETADGKEATVSVGQNIKDYGTVVGIYVNQGIVTTTSGRVITFKDSSN